MKIDELSMLLRNAGVVGCGGAGFPSYAKLKDGIDTVILNCAECEPLLRLHRQLMEKRAYEILSALDLTRKTLGAKNVVIGLKSAYKNAIAAIEKNIASFNNINICKLREVYPAGDEVVLIYEATGRIVPPGSLPASVGVVVFNVETMYNLYRATQGKNVTHKYVTVAGEVKSPRTYLAPIGMTLGELIDMSGGETTENPAYLLGGPMMGSLGSREDVVTKTTNAVIVLPDDHYVVMRKNTKISIDLKRAMAACCQCRYCTDMCPRNLLGHPIEPHMLMRVASNRDTHNTEPYLNTFFCSGCGVCEMYACFQGLSPRTLIGAVKGGLRASGVKAPKIEKEPSPVHNRELRRVPLSRLRARLDLEKYNRSAPITDDAIEPSEVKILLSQHIGAPSVACVKCGDMVTAGDVVAKAEDGKLGVDIHSSISGKVTDVTDKFIIVRR